MDDRTDTASPSNASGTAAPGRDDPLRELRHRDHWVPLFAVAAVAVAALAAVLLPSRMHEAPAKTSKADAGSAFVSKAEVPAASGRAATDGPVVKAPPLAAPRPARPAAQAMGGPPACTNCGVVENVVAIHGTTNGKTEAVGFIMNIRMDDGSSRTVEQRGALAAGSRVIVEHDTVRAATPYG